MEVMVMRKSLSLTIADHRLCSPQIPNKNNLQNNYITSITSSNKLILRIICQQQVVEQVIKQTHHIRKNIKLKMYSASKKITEVKI
jgi:hypothetical protein